MENSKKWRLQERDDWKALVDSVQNDRSRLQDECFQLESKLEVAVQEINRLREELIRAESMIRPLQVEEPFSDSPSSERSSFTPISSPQSPLTVSEQLVLHGLRPLSIKSDSPAIEMLLSEAKSEAGSPEKETPRASAQRYKLELEKLQAQMEVERRSALAEKLSLEEEILRLRRQLEHVNLRRQTEYKFDSQVITRPLLISSFLLFCRNLSQPFLPLFLIYSTSSRHICYHQIVTGTGRKTSREIYCKNI